MTSSYQRLDHGITVVDTGFVRPRFDASYLLVENGRAAFIETGPNSGVPRLLAALEAQGLERDAVDYVIPTHIHLDHAGGVGLLMSKLPRAKLIIHPRGARHMVDPTALVEGARAVYGREVADRDYGELVSVPAGRIVTTEEGMVMEDSAAVRCGSPTRRATRDITTASGTKRAAAGSPATRSGSRIPICTRPTDRTCCLRPRRCNSISRRCTKPSARLLAQRPDVMYLTHYGAVRDAEKLAVQFLAQVDAMAAAARSLANAPSRHEALQLAFREIYVAELRQLGLDVDGGAPTRAARAGCSAQCARARDLAR